MVKDLLVRGNFEVVDVTKDGQDFVDVTLAVAARVISKRESWVVIGAYSVKHFMVTAYQD